MGATKPVVSALLLFFCGCKAQPSVQGDAALRDLALDDGGEEPDLSSTSDLTALPDLQCPINAVEICGNGCDDDRNGYTDDDDPACTPQILATWEGGSSTLQRLVLQPPFSTGFVDGNQVPATARGVYSRAFASGVAFLVNEGAAMELDRITLPPGMMGKGALQANFLNYAARDVCIFHGELIVVERRGFLHRLAADGKTENGMVQLPSWTAVDTYLTSCASDGRYLYVSEHFGILASQFEILDNSFAPVASPSPMPMPMNSSIDRCLDFAWTRNGFYGLFVDSGGSTSDDVPADVLAAFSMDGGIGSPIDAGKLLHGMGEFTP